jgi:regulator-associated protein of mTOR
VRAQGGVQVSASFRLFLCPYFRVRGWIKPWCRGLMGVPRGSSSRQRTSFYTEPRHLPSTLEDWEADGSPDPEAQEWRIRSTRTYGGVLAVCLNVEVEPPDCPFPRALQTGAGRLLCGIDPNESNQTDPRKVVARIGSQLEAQYDQIVSSRSTVFKQCLDPTVEQVHRNCRKLRREAKDDTLLFHFNGHGVPAPSLLGEIWLFSDSYTEYVPVRAVEVAEWLGRPAVFVLDCPHAGRVVRALAEHVAASPHSPQGQGAQGQGPRGQGQGQGDVGGSWPLIALGATHADERLPCSSSFPADVFTACLTRPLEMALRLASQSVLRRGAAHYTYGAADPAGLVGAIPGTLADRRSPLGELNWVLTAVADSIAWQLLPQPLFRRLFRQVRLYLLPGPYCPALTSRPR